MDEDWYEDAEVEDKVKWAKRLKSMQGSRPPGN